MQWEMPETDGTMTAGGGSAAGTWEEATDESGYAYYYNTLTGEVSWESPY
jgi:hypothetical protein